LADVRTFSFDPGKGTPIGSSVRTDTHIATLIQTLEPYVPSLNRDHGEDTYRISLFRVPLDGAEPGLKGTMIVARADTSGRILWSVDTGIDRFELQQILPGNGSVAFIGTRLPIPGKVSGP